MINCPDCDKEMQINDWTKDIKIAVCEPCKTRKYWSISKDRFLTLSEINAMADDWQ